MPRFAVALLVLVLAMSIARESEASSATQNDARKTVQFASPLQSLTIWDKQKVKKNQRSEFLPKYKAGLAAEFDTRTKLAEERGQNTDSTGDNWADKAATSDRVRRKNEDQLVERAFDKAVTMAPTTSATEGAVEVERPTKEKGYQFVGVVNKPSASSSDKPITWYARPKPAHSNWSLRLVHVNRDAIIKDLFQRGKVDVFAKYGNTGQVDEETRQPIIKSKYQVRERSWRTLWNFSPKNLFTDSSGMYWRERRVSPGVYTDGLSVYESSYRYSDGRNGMHRISSFGQFLNSKAVDASKKGKILKKMKEDPPDLVLEE